MSFEIVRKISKNENNIILQKYYWLILFMYADGSTAEPW